MSKKKKTRLQKAHADIRRMQQLDNLVKLGDNVSSGINSSKSIQAGLASSGSFVGTVAGLRVGIAKNSASLTELAESEYIMRDIKKCLYLIGLFALAFIVVYFINQKTEFLNTFGAQILEFLMKK